MSGAGLSLREVVEALADETAATRRGEPDGALAWSTGDCDFAFLTDETVELRLDPTIAAAAAATPDTSPSVRGPEWVRFAPRDLDDHAIDRLEAWFGLAYRRARK